ncbi:MAG: helix-turn-helix domain-containing protein [Deltaproteobacteria bacterium]|nr:helix-turn-helix domain-containing protein [Deltaproteobacteria bacterium]
MILDLRGERRRLGLTLRDVSRKTGIPVDVLAALEEETGLEGAPGGSVHGYRKTYLEFLGLDDDLADLPEPPIAGGGVGAEPTETTTPQTGPWGLGPIPVVRTVLAGVAVVVLILLVLWVAATVLGSEPILSGTPVEIEVAEPVDEPPAAQAVAEDPEPQGPLSTGPRRVEVRAIEPTRVVVEVDGARVQDSILTRGTVRFEGQQEVSVYAPDLTRVEVRLDGIRVRPLGNLTRPRRLVFVNDLEE